MNSHDGELYGHVVAGSPGSKLSYIVAAQEVFDDVELSQGIKLKLPNSNHSNDAAEDERIQGILQLKISISEDFKILGNPDAFGILGIFKNPGFRVSHVFAVCVVNGSEWTSAPLGYSRAHEKFYSNRYLKQEAFL